MWKSRTRAGEAGRRLLVYTANVFVQDRDFGVGNDQIRLVEPLIFSVEGLAENYQHSSKLNGQCTYRPLTGLRHMSETVDNLDAVTIRWRAT